jgi:hypothetical protein
MCHRRRRCLPGIDDRLRRSRPDDPKPVPGDFAVIASPIRPRTQRQEPGIAAGGRLAHPRNALRRFTFVHHHDASMTSFRPALTEAPQRQQAHWDRPVEFRTAPLPLRCWIPAIRAPGQDSHLRSQRPCQAHLRSPTAHCAKRPQHVQTPVAYFSTGADPARGVNSQPALRGQFSTGCVHRVTDGLGGVSRDTH